MAHNSPITVPRTLWALAVVSPKPKDNLQSLALVVASCHLLPMNNSTSTTSAPTEMRPRKVGLLYTVTNKETKDETDKRKDPSTKTPMSSHPKGVLQRQQEKFRMHQLFGPRVKPYEASTFLVTKRI